jgi:hypothetical protein
MCLTYISLYCSGPAQASDVMILDTHRGDLVEISSSSYGLSLFCLKADSRHGENARAAVILGFYAKTKYSSYA